MNAQTLHLAVIQPTLAADGNPTQVGALCHPDRAEVVWNASFTAFRIVPLRWWDDASYAAYQAVDIGDDDVVPAELAAAVVMAPRPASSGSAPSDLLF